MAVVALLAAAPYINSLHGKFAYDDKVAVIGNPDVVVHSIPWGDLMKHECVWMGMALGRLSRAR